MGLLTALGFRTHRPSDGGRASVGEQVRCRSCGRYYDPDRSLCPHCDSGNTLRSGPPVGQAGS